MKKIIVMICFLGMNGIAGSDKKNDYYAQLYKYVGQIKASKTYGVVSEKTLQAGAWLKKGFFSKNNILLRDQAMAPIIVLGVVLYAAVQRIYKAEKAEKKRKGKAKKFFVKNSTIA